jgi:thioredoxin-dependent peroxiredoxin
MIGISPDTPAAQKRFQEKESLPFPLLADVERKVAAAYGVLREKSMYGRKFLGIERTTVVIGPEGEVRRVLAPVKPAGHAEEVLQALAQTGPADDAGPAPDRARRARGRGARR